MKTIFLSLVLMLPALTHAQASATPAMTANGAFFALSVADLKTSSQWYADKLGMKIIMQVPRTDEQKTAVAILEGGGLIVELIERDSSLPLAKAAPGVKGNLDVHGIFKAGFIVEDFERTLATLKARGVEVAFGPFPAKDTQRANVIIKDNAGNLIQIFGK